jgi:hypothetical protein
MTARIWRKIAKDMLYLLRAFRLFKGQSDAKNKGQGESQFTGRPENNVLCLAEKEIPCGHREILQVGDLTIFVPPRLFHDQNMWTWWEITGT